MKCLIAVLVATTAVSTVAYAADLPQRALPPAIVPVPVFSWTGFYGGFNAGYGFDVLGRRAPTVLSVPGNVGIFGGNTGGVLAFSNSANADGFVGGGQVGYNFQFTPGSGFVFGMEADAQYVDFGSNRNRYTSSIVVAPGARIFNPNGVSSLDFFGSFRGRVGYAIDRTMVYGTGGFAYGSGGGERFGYGVKKDDFQTGYTVGGGIEYALPTESFLNFFRSSAVILKIEGLYVNLDRGSNNATAFAVNANGLTITTATRGVALLSGAT